MCRVAHQRQRSSDVQISDDQIMQDLYHSHTIVIYPLFAMECNVRFYGYVYKKVRRTFRSFLVVPDGSFTASYSSGDVTSVGWQELVELLFSPENEFVSA